MRKPILVILGLVMILSQVQSRVSSQTPTPALPSKKEIFPGTFYDGFQFEIKKCPETLGEWRGWRNAVLDNIGVEAFKTGGFNFFRDYQACLEEEKNKELFSRDPRAKACMKRLVDLWKTQVSDDGDYVKRVQAKNPLPDLFLNPQFYQALYDTNDVDLIERMIPKNWDFHPTSKIFYIRGDPPTWINAGNVRGLIDVVTIDPKPSPETEAGRRYRPYYMEYSVQPEENDPKQIKVKPLLENDIRNCYQCHKTGLIQLPGNQDAKVMQHSRRFNEEILRFGKVDWGSEIDIDHFGPPMGMNSPEARAARTDDFLKSCSQGIVFSDQALAFQALRKGMRCARCHNDRRESRLNFPRGYEEIITEGFEGRRHMPPFKLHDDPNEEKLIRQALAACLNEEYYGPGGTFRSWLAEDPCDAKPRTTSGNGEQPREGAEKSLDLRKNLPFDSGAPIQVKNPRNSDSGDSSLGAK